MSKHRTKPLYDASTPALQPQGAEPTKPIEPTQREQQLFGELSRLKKLLVSERVSHGTVTKTLTFRIAALESMVADLKDVIFMNISANFRANYD